MANFSKEEDLKVQDVFDMDFLQELQDSFARSVGMTAVTVDLNGTPITRPTDWTDFCMKHTRNSSLGCKSCQENDRIGGETAAKTGRPFVYECHAGLMDFGAPIMVNGKQIGSILGGQVITEPLDEEKYRRYAAEINVNPEEYVKAVRKIQLVPKARLDNAAQTLFLIASVFSKMGYYQYRLKKVANSINDKLTQLSATMQELAASANDVKTNQESLNGEIQNVDKISGDINEVTDLIKDIADQTQLLGLNASIEAARAGVAGAGFGVVAQEIRKLSGNSKETVEKIREFTGMINTSVTETVMKGKQTSAIVEQQATAIETVANDLVSLSQEAAELSDLASHR
jgi:ligand-binding sensor protein